MTDKRGPGRPQGTGIKDEADLIRIAEILLANPKFKPTTAMRKHIMDGNFPVTGDQARIRRWQEKWKAGSSAYLAAARTREEERARRMVARNTAQRSPGGFERVALEQLRMLDTSPQVKAINDLLNHSNISNLNKALKGAVAAAFQ